MMASNTRGKCKTFLRYETGKEPILEIDIMNEWDPNQCIFKTLYEKGNYKTITKQIVIPTIPTTWIFTK